MYHPIYFRKCEYRKCELLCNFFIQNSVLDCLLSNRFILLLVIFFCIILVYKCWLFISDHLQQQYPNQQPIRNSVPQQAPLYQPQHVSSNHVNYVAATVVQPIYHTPQGYQIPAVYAYSGHGDQYATIISNKLNQKTVSETLVAVNNYIPQENVTVHVPQPMILQKPPQINATVHPVVMPQPYVTVATPASVNQTIVSVANPVRDNCPKAVLPTNTVITANANVAKSSHLPLQNTNAISSVPEQPQVEVKQNGADINGTPQNKSWASLFNKGKKEENKKVEQVVMNGCAKVEQTPTSIEEYDDEFAAIKKKLREKYDDPTFFRIGGNNIYIIE